MKKLLNEPYYDHAIIQRDKIFSLSGTVAAHEKVRVALEGDSINEFFTTADGEGLWQIQIPSQEAGGPYNLKIQSTNDFYQIEDVYFGDVFFLCGQSNMQLPVVRTLEKIPEGLLSHIDDLIRELRLPLEPNFDPGNDLWPKGAKWISLSPSSVMEMGALGLATALVYREEKQVPVGLINAAVGGTPIESWLPHQDLVDQPNALAEFAKYSDESIRQAIDAEFVGVVDTWTHQAEKKESKFRSHHTSIAWNKIAMPTMFFDTPYEDKRGYFWLKFDFELSSDLFEQCKESKNLVLELGAFRDADRTYLNGKFVGETGYQYPPRKYRLDPMVLSQGVNHVFIQLIVQRGTGGATKKDFYGLSADGQKIAFGSNWEIVQTAEMPELPNQRFWDRLAGSCYFTYVQPCIGIQVHSILWYQGESNSGQRNYSILFQRLIRRYQSLWGEEVGVYFVQLPLFDDPTRIIQEFSWAEMREQQREALAEENTDMIVSLDLGEADDLHPQDKWTLGKRLANSILGKERSPRVIGAKQECSNEITILLDQAVVPVENPQNGFELLQSGSWISDGIQLARMDGNSIIFKVPDGEYQGIRYLFRNNPIGPKVCNEAGLLLSPFCLPVATCANNT